MFSYQLVSPSYVFYDTVFIIAESNIYYFSDESTVADPIFDYPSSLREEQIPIVIDNGRPTAIGIDHIYYKYNCTTIQ